MVVLVVRPTCPTSVTLPPNIQRLIAVLTCGEAEGKAKLSPPPRSQVEHLVPAHIVRRNKVLDEVSTAIPRDRVARNAEVTCERERDRLTDWLLQSLAWKHPGKKISHSSERASKPLCPSTNQFGQPLNIADNLSFRKKSQLRSPRGAEGSATQYSLIETAKANGIEPYAYLRLLCTELPKAESDEEIKALLPQYLDRARLIIK